MLSLNRRSGETKTPWIRSPRAPEAQIQHHEEEDRPECARDDGSSGPQYPLEPLSGRQDMRLPPLEVDQQARYEARGEYEVDGTRPGEVGGDQAHDHQGENHSRGSEDD